MSERKHEKALPCSKSIMSPLVRLSFPELVILGEKQVGKSSIVRRFVSQVAVMFSFDLIMPNYV